MDSFLDFNPTIAIILNIEMDHVDYFHSMEQIRSSFARFASLTGAGGYAIVNGDDPQVLEAMAGYAGTLIRFGMESADLALWADNVVCKRGKHAFDVYTKEGKFCHISLGVTGHYQIYNALACVAACRLCGLSVQQIEAGLGSFCGAKRRMEYKGTLMGGDVYEDYGHHPTEIRATLKGARGLPDEGGRLFCVYQPHTYSRTHALFDEFAAAFDDADRVLMVDIYAAREVDTLGVSSEKLARAIGEKAESCGTFAGAADALRREMTDKDVAIIMGAGDVYKVLDCLGDDLRSPRKDRE
jgi:UDP-N-acetylmuramate--alanine ligase